MHVLLKRFKPMIAGACMIAVAPVSAAEAGPTRLAQLACSRPLFVGNRSMMLAVAAGGGGPNNMGANYTHGESFYTSTNGPTAVKGLQLTYANFALGPDEHSIPVNNALDVEAAVTVNDTAPVRVTFGSNHASTVTIPKEGEVQSNVVPITIPPYAKFTIRSGVFVKAGQTWPVGFSNYNRGDNAVASDNQTSHVMDRSKGVPKSTGGVANQLGYGPISAIGCYQSPEVAIASVGDSLTTGNTGRGNGNGDGDRGTLPYGYATVASGRIAYSKLARDSAFLMAFNDDHKSRARLGQLQYATDVVVWLGTNDVGANSVQRLQETLSRVWAKAREDGRRVIAVTLPPRATSSDHFGSIRGQTPRTAWAPGGKRDLLNAWIKEQVGGRVDEVLDFNPVWENAEQHGTWKVGFTTDGTHPNEAGMQATAPLVASAAGRWRKMYLACYGGGQRTRYVSNKQCPVDAGSAR